MYLLKDFNFELFHSYFDIFIGPYFSYLFINIK